MRHVFLPALLGLAVFLLPGGAQTLVVLPTPGSFNDVETDIGIIENDLKNAQCGGWRWDISAGPDASNPDSKGLIPNVTGVPGHGADPFGHIESGMARRDALPTWPSNVQGFTSACRPGFPEFYEWEPCQRPAGTESELLSIEGMIGPKIFKEPSLGGAHDDPFDDAEETGSVQWTCDALCEDLNRRWIWDRYKETCDYIDHYDGENPVYNRAEWFLGTRCFDTDTITSEEREALKPQMTGRGCVVNSPLNPPAPRLGPRQEMYCCTNTPKVNPTTDEYPNCMACSGDECSQELPNPDFEQLPYISYYRRYEGSCNRDPLVLEENDGGAGDGEDGALFDDSERTDVPVSCYGLYNAYDPENTVSGFWEYKCVIANTYEESSHDFVNMPQSQAVPIDLVDYGQRFVGEGEGAIWLDPPSDEYKIVRNPDFGGTETSLWYQNLGGGFSLLDTNTFKNTYGNNFTYALLSPDTTELKAYPQLTEKQLYSSGAYIRAFDDTVSNERWGRRSVVEWWQELETEASKLFSPPQVRLLLPPAWSIGLDPLDPFFSPDVPDEANPQKDSDPRTEPLEVQLKVEEDLLGEVAAYMERSLLFRLQEEAVPVVVPFGSPTEYRAKAHAWCTWFMHRQRSTNCDGDTGDVGELIDRLEEYADRLEKYRALRTELARYQSSLLGKQQAMISAIGNWLLSAMQQYAGFRESVLALSPLQDLWRNAQRMYQKFHDTTNMPWCMNQRFTTPIYSLLDMYGWFPGRPNLDGCLDSTPSTSDSSCLPRFTVNQIPDAVLDFSRVRTATGAIRFPVLKPIQISLARYELDPPDPSAESPVIPTLPALPAVPSIFEEVVEGIPAVVIEQQPPTIGTFFPPATSTISDSSAFNKVGDVLYLMNLAYGKFWDSLTLDPADVTDGTEEDCLAPFNTTKCVHTEMDLMERFTRMCSRPGVFLQEDFESAGKPIDPFTTDFDQCPRWDWSCQLLNQEKERTQKGWGLRVPDEADQEATISALRKRMFEETLLRENVDDAEKLRFFVNPDEITPSFETQGTTDLIPSPAPSSSPSPAP